MVKKMTQEEIVAKVAITSPNTEIIGVCQSTMKSVNCRCKVCGFDAYPDGRPWMPTPNNLFSGKGCPRCKCLLKKTDTIFKQEMEITNPDIAVKGEYINNHTGIWCECKICGFDRYSDGKLWKPIPSGLLNGMGCPRCSKRLQKTEEEFKLELASIHPTIKVKNHYINRRTKVWCECEVCGFDRYPDGTLWEPMPYALLQGTGCPHCCGNVVVRGDNDLWTLRPDIAEMLEDKTLGYQIGIGHRAKHNLVCPDCGTIQPKSIAQVCHYGFSCKVCSDGISYPNRLMMALLELLYIDYEPEFSFRNKGYRYDFYIKDYNLIIEMNGIQHYEESDFTERTLQEEQDNDYNKMCFAKQNGILNYITIDCRESYFNYIWNNINKSALVNILDLSIVDTKKLCINASKSLFKKIYELWENDYGTKDIGELLKVSRNTVIRYLKIANEVGLINYSTDISIDRSCHKTAVAINRYTKDGIFIDTFLSAQNAYATTGIDPSSIRKCCNHKLKSFHNFLWFNTTDPTQPDQTKITPTIHND